MRQRSSRLTRTYKKHNKRMLLGSLVGFIILSLVLLNYFPLILATIGKLGQKDDLSAQIQNSKSFLLPPQLDPIPEATDSAFIEISGTTTTDAGTVEILINDFVSDRVEIENGAFKSELLKLSEGLNTIRARLRSGGSKSELSEESFVTVVKGDPNLEIQFPNNGDNFVKADKRITVKGKTDPNNSVTVNGFRAVVNTDGSFSYIYDLNEGDNRIEVEAKNTVGKSRVETVAVTYSKD